MNTNLTTCNIGQMMTRTGGRHRLVTVTAKKEDDPVARASGLSYRSTPAALMKNDRHTCRAKKADAVVVQFRIGIKTGVLKAYVKDHMILDLLSGKMNMGPCLTIRNHQTSEAWEGRQSYLKNILVEICVMLT